MTSHNGSQGSRNQKQQNPVSGDDNKGKQYNSARGSKSQTKHPNNQ